MGVSMLVVMFFPLFCLTSYSLDDESYLALDFTSIDRSNYVDPHDMLNYNRKESQGIRKEKMELKIPSDQKIPEELTPGLIDQSKDSLEEDVPLQMVTSEKGIDQHTPECLNEKPANCSSCMKNTTLELPFLGRFVKVLSGLLQLKEKHIEDGDVLYIPLLAVVNIRTKFVLNEITKEGEEIQLKNLADLDEILTNLLILKKDNLECQPHLSFVEMIFTSGLLQPKDWVMAMFVASLAFVLWLTFKGYSYSYILSRSFLPFFMISWFWHWNYMNQMASSKRHSDMSKNPNIPSACNPDQLGTLDILKLRFHVFWGYPDPCEEYHRVLLTDPSFEVNPFTALVDMLIVGILHPLGYIGSKMGSFFNEVLSSASLLNKIPVLVAVLAILILIIIMTFGYEIHLPLFKIRPSPFVSVRRAEAIQEIMQGSTVADQQVYLERHTSTLSTTYSQVQAVEEGVQDAIEDCLEDSTLSPVIIEELVGSVMEIAMNTSIVVRSVEQRPEDCSQGTEEKLQSENFTKLMDEISTVVL